MIRLKLVWFFALFSGLGKTDSSLLRSVNEIQNTLQKLVTKNKILENRIEELETSCKYNGRQSRLLESDIGQATKTSFSAYVSSTQTGVGDHQTIKFDHVITNNGNAYNPLDGIFRAKNAGTYVFAWTITAEIRKFLSSEIVKDGVRIATMYSDAGDHDDKGSATNIVVLNLSPGNEVWIQTGLWHTKQINGDDGHSMFTGWQL